MAVVQRLHDMCKATFTLSAPPSPQALQRVRALLDGVKLSDVGLSEESLQQQERGFGQFGVNGGRGRHSLSARWTPPISYLHLYECDSFSMGVFCLPTSATIPLHNHPGMTVLSKVLCGSMHVRAYDWVDGKLQSNNGDDANSKPREAKLVVDQITTCLCETAILHPTSGGNIHAFTALSPCAVLDVLAPPYAPKAGRNCTYYREYLNGFLPPGGVAKGQSINDEDEQRYKWLEEFQPPDDFVVQRREYSGSRSVS